jgi:2-keto-4-pentenoate hydratase/2-oxohepta-3-ene-1,7-dioic acid hydratase in catechol pathway
MLGRVIHADRQHWAELDLGAGTASLLTGRLADLSPSGPTVDLSQVNLVAPVEPSSRVLGVGANYREHLSRLGVPIPESPACFHKPLSALVGPGEGVVYPAITSQFDYEVELVVIIGRDRPRSGKPLTDIVLGYTVGNDGSARDAKSPLGGVDLFGMKCLDSTTPLGPWVATVEELGPPEGLDVEISLSVNGEERQRDHTGDMLWDIAAILKHLDARVQLRAGDVVFTGTTGGVGLEDGRFLQVGDQVVARVDGIGELRNTVVSYQASASLMELTGGRDILDS